MSAPDSDPPRPPSAAAQLEEALGRTVRAWLREAREEARALGLSVPQLFLLGGLSRLGEIPATRWAEMAGITPSTATSLLDGLEAEGHIVRAHDTRDRRQVLVSLTPKGRRLTDQLHEARRARWKEACRGVPAAELGAAAATLERILARQAESPSGPAREPTPLGPEAPR